ncbi:MAG: superinfection immunity protein [Gammaproteobacteria bacterium]|jgi:hypothetical protein
MTLEIASLVLIVVAVIIIVWGIAVVHTLPGKIATKRGHSQVKAIEITSYLGLLVFPLWMAALIWAYIEPVKVKATIETEEGEPESPQREYPATVQVGAEGTEESAVSEG